MTTAFASSAENRLVKICRWEMVSDYSSWARGSALWSWNLGIVCGLVSGSSQAWSYSAHSEILCTPIRTDLVIDGVDAEEVTRQ
jgi:NADH:ubiquinone oxidoreductase subunit B-like Fe-S oxidoreductase